MDYRLRFKEPPAPAHLDDIFDHVLGDTNHKQYQVYARILVGMREQAPSLNVQFLVERVVSFARRQRLKSGVIEAAERLQQGGENTDEEVEKILRDTLTTRVETADYGERLSDQPFSFWRKDLYEDGIRFKTGIDLLDRYGLAPTRKTVYALLGRKKAGKSWFLQYLDRRASRQLWNVAKVTLENRVDLVKERFAMSWFSAGQTDDPYIKAEFRTDNKGILDNIDYQLQRPMFAFNKPGDRQKVEDLAKRWKREMGRIVMKEWPSGFLTIPMLERWLDGLESEWGFIPDLLSVDMPQLMRLDPKDRRGSFGQVTVDLRRIAGERNMAVAIVLHTNRGGETAKLIRTKDVAEDISQIGTVDTVLTYNRTDAESRMGLARLHVAAARGARDGHTILLSQAYDVGQFHLGSVMFDNQSYWGMLEGIDQTAQREDLGSGRQREIYDDTDYQPGIDED